MVVQNIKNAADIRTVVTDASNAATGSFDAAIAQDGSAAPTIPGDSYAISFPVETPIPGATEPTVIVATDGAGQDVGQVVKPSSDNLAISASWSPSNGQNSVTDFLFLDAGGRAHVVLENTGTTDTPFLDALFIGDDPNLTFSPYTTGESGIQIPFSSSDSEYGTISALQGFRLEKGERYTFFADISISAMRDPGAEREDRKVIIGFFSGNDLLWRSTLTFRFYRDSYRLLYDSKGSNAPTSGVIITPDSRSLPLPHSDLTYGAEIPLPRLTEGYTYIAVVDGSYRFGIDTRLPPGTTIRVEGMNEVHNTRETATILAIGDTYSGSASPSGAPDYLAIDLNAAPTQGASEPYALTFVRIQNVHQVLNNAIDYGDLDPNINKGETVYAQLVFKENFLGDIPSGHKVVRLEAMDSGPIIVGSPFGANYLYDPAEPGTFTQYGNDLRISIPREFTNDMIHMRVSYFDGVKDWSDDFELPIAPPLIY